MASQIPVERIGLLGKEIFSPPTPETETSELFKLSVIALVKHFLSTRTKHTYVTEHQNTFTYDDEVGLGDLDIIHNIVSIVSVYPELREAIVYACVHELHISHSSETQSIRTAELLFVLDPHLSILARYTHEKPELFVRDQKRIQYETQDIQMIYPAVARRMLSYRHPNFTPTNKAKLANTVWTTFKNQAITQESYVYRTYEALYEAVRITPELAGEPTFPWNETLELAAHPDFIPNYELHGVIRLFIRLAPRHIVTNHAVGLSRYLKSFANERELQDYNRSPVEKDRAVTQSSIFEQFADAKPTTEIVKNMMLAEVSAVRVFVRSLDREGKELPNYATIEHLLPMLKTTKVKFDALSNEEKQEVAKPSIKPIVYLWQEAFTKSFSSETTARRYNILFTEIFTTYFEPVIRITTNDDCDKEVQSIISSQSQRDSVGVKAVISALSKRPDYLNLSAPQNEEPRWVTIARSMDTRYYEGKTILETVFNGDLSAFALACYTYGLEDYLKKSDISARPEIFEMKRAHVDQRIDRVYRDLLKFVTNMPEEDVQVEEFEKIFARFSAIEPFDDIQANTIATYIYFFCMDSIKSPKVSIALVETIADLIESGEIPDTEERFKSSDMRLILRAAPAGRLEEFELYYVSSHEQNPNQLVGAIEAGEISEYGAAISHLFEITPITRITGKRSQDVKFSRRLLQIIEHWFDSIKGSRIKTLDGLTTSDRDAVILIITNPQYRTFCRRIPNFDKKYQSILKLVEKYSK